MMLAHQGALVINPHLYGNPGFDTIRDFAAVSRGMTSAAVLVVHPSVAAKTMKELASLAKQNPGKLTFASTASLQQLLGELFRLTTGTDMVHVPYKGAADYTTAVLGAHVDMTFGSVPTALPHIRTGVLRALGATTAKRVKVLPDLPTIAESGLPGYDISSWYGIFAPAGTPPSIVNLLRAEIARGIATKAVMDRLPDYELIANTPAEFGVFLRKDAEMTARVIARSGATAD